MPASPPYAAVREHKRNKKELKTYTWSTRARQAIRHNEGSVILCRGGEGMRARGRATGVGASTESIIIEVARGERAILLEDAWLGSGWDC